MPDGDANAVTSGAAPTVTTPPPATPPAANPATEEEGTAAPAATTAPQADGPEGEAAAAEEEEGRSTFDSYFVRARVCNDTVASAGLVFMPDCKGFESGVRLRLNDYNNLDLYYSYDTYNASPTAQRSETVRRHAVGIGSAERIGLFSSLNTHRLHVAAIKPVIIDSSAQDDSFGIDVETSDGIEVPLIPGGVAIHVGLVQSAHVFTTGPIHPYEFGLSFGIEIPPADTPEFEELLEAAETRLEGAKTKKSELQTEFSGQVAADPKGATSLSEEDRADAEAAKTALEGAISVLEDSSKSVKDLKDDEEKYGAMLFVVEDLLEEKGVRGGTPEYDQILRSASFRNEVLEISKTRLKEVQDQLRNPVEEYNAQIASLDAEIAAAEKRVKELKSSHGPRLAMANMSYTLAKMIISHRLADRAQTVWRLPGPANDGAIPRTIQLDLLNGFTNDLPASFAYQRMMENLPEGLAVGVGLASAVGGGAMMIGGLRADDSAVYGTGHFLAANGLAGLPRSWAREDSEIWERLLWGFGVSMASTIGASMFLANDEKKRFGTRMLGTTSGIFLFNVGDVVDQL